MLPAFSRPRVSRGPTAMVGLSLITGTAGVFAWVLHRHVSPMLVDAPSCAGLVTSAAALAARAMPEAPLGRVMLGADGVLLGAAIACLIHAAWRHSGRMLVAIATGVCAVYVATQSVALGSLPSLEMLAAVLSLGGIANRSPTTTFAGFALTIAAWPQCSIFLAVAYVLWCSSSAGFSLSPGIRRVGLGAVLFGMGVAGLWFSRSRSGALPDVALWQCLLPDPSLTTWLAAVSGTADATGPFVLTLACMGLLDGLLDPGRGRLVRFWPALGYVVLTSWTADATQGASAAGLRTAVWLVSAVGLAAVLRTCRPTVIGRIAAVLLLLLGPALQWQAWGSRQAEPANARMGHGDISMAALRIRLERLPPGAVLISEDALSDVLLRAMPTGAPRSVRLTPAALWSLLAEHPSSVFAMPRTQTDIQLRGLRLTDVAGAPGIAAVSRGGECRAVSAPWRSLPDLARSSALSLVARTPQERGPVVIYLTFNGAPSIGPLHWPTPGHRGIYATSYDAGVPAQWNDLLTDRASDGLTDPLVAAAGTHVVRLELWRPPHAPVALALQLGLAPSSAMASVQARAEPRRISVCPAFPHDVLALAP